ncbi:MAG: thiol:disulfide interchange protein DsbA/DsbL [Gammaproteobacteria bacterium SHHR-1]|uniref:thiol:disulfide interchange protein DsbA/DsbL n=1 Tax=Magnetovirga frankeli TaxID=947516 RepID=UPI001292F7A4|nr:thiol:disulfide interchange protein DsbA/DsbL [gamma proteobacterium SS-5]
MLKKLLLALLLTGLPLLALAAGPFKENQNYFEIFPSYPGTEPGKIEVVEFFMYTCPHCYDFEPHLLDWLKTKPEDVDFIKVPAIFNPQARFFAETYYSLEILGVDHSVHEKIFAAIHDQRRDLGNVDAMARFLGETGIDADSYRKQLKSFAVQARVNRADELVKRFSIRAVPSMVINGAWRTGQVASFEQMLQLVDHLIDKSRSEAQAEQP